MASPTSSTSPTYRDYHDSAPPLPSQDPNPDRQPLDFHTTHPPNLPTPPFIHIHGVPNFRDSGGYACPAPPGSDPSKQYMVRKNVLFRCAHPTQLTNEGARKLRDLGITDIFDLRSLPEIERLANRPPTPTGEEPNALNGAVNGPSDGKGLGPEDRTEALDTSQGYVVIPGVRRTFTPVYQREDYSPVALARKLKWYTAGNEEGRDYSEGFVNAYRDIARYAAEGGSYAIILRQLLRSLEVVNGKEGQRGDGAGGLGVGGRRTAAPRPASVLANLDGIEAHHEMFPDTPPRGRTPEPEVQTENRDGGLIFHCTAGKDRTGVLGAIILKLCGVDTETICWEYAITEPGLGDWRTVFIDRISRGGLGGGGSGKAGDSGKGCSRAEAARICGSRAGNVRRWMEVVLEGEWGGVERYLTEMVGLSEDEVRRLREGLVVEAKEGEVVEPVSIEGWTLDGGMDDEFSVHEKLVRGEGAGEENGKLGLDTSAGREKEQKVMMG